MSKKRWFRLFGMDFLGSRRVIAMNTPERGAYLQLLILAWDDEHCSLPKDEKELRELVGWSDQWGSFKKVRACFTAHPDHPGRLYNERLWEEYLYCQNKSDAAKESAKSRWHKPDQSRTPSKAVRMPVRTPDRPSKGFESIKSEVATVTEKYFPPIS